MADGCIVRAGQGPAREQIRPAGLHRLGLVRLVQVDFPRHKSQDAALKETNERLAETYKIRGFPTVIILNSSALPVAQTGYVEGGPKNFLAPLERLPGIK